MSKRRRFRLYVNSRAKNKTQTLSPLSSTSIPRRGKEEREPGINVALVSENGLHVVYRTSPLAGF